MCALSFLSYLQSLTLYPSRFNLRLSRENEMKPVFFASDMNKVVLKSTLYYDVRNTHVTISFIVHRNYLENHWTDFYKNRVKESNKTR